MQMHAVLAVVVALSGAGAAVAGPLSDKAVAGFENRQERQGERIDAGVASGRIGAREEIALNRQQGSFDRALDRQASDGGRLSAREAYRLDNRFDRGSRNIRVAKARPRG